jgi:hypothetical protein
VVNSIENTRALLPAYGWRDYLFNPGSVRMKKQMLSIPTSDLVQNQSLKLNRIENDLFLSSA